MSRSRFDSLLASSLLALMVAVAGCGDDDDDTGDDDDDDTPITCGMGTHQEGTECVADGPDAEEKPCEDDITCPEGGEVRVEYVTVTDPAPGGRSNFGRFTVFLLSNAATGETPDAFPVVQFNQCNDIGMHTIWPNAQNEDREYVDFGQAIVDAGGTGGPRIVPPMAAPPAIDSVGRTHNGHAAFIFGGIDDGPVFISDNHPVDVFLTGSDTFPATVFDDYTFIPKAFDLIDPVPGTGSKAFTLGQDHVFTYEVVESDTEEPIGFFFALTIGGEPRVVCPELQDGSFTLPAAALATAATYGTAGIFARQTFVHKIHDIYLDGTHRRVDALTAWCNVTPFTIVSP